MVRFRDSARIRVMAKPAGDAAGDATVIGKNL